MNAVTFLFYFFAFTAALGACAVLFSSNVFKSALYLLTTLISMAALYALTFAEFLAVAQILIYAGGIAVIIIFGVMLTTRITGRPLVVRNKHVFSGGIVGLALFVLLIRYLPHVAITRQSMQPEDITFIATNIFSAYSVPFELAGLLLLVALIGAAVITSHLKAKA